MELKELARKGAEVHLEELRQERAELYKAFPESRRVVGGVDGAGIRTLSSGRGRRVAAVMPQAPSPER